MAVLSEGEIMDCTEKLGQAIFALCVATIFLVAVFLFTECTSLSMERATVRISETMPGEYRPISNGLYYDPDTYIVYSGTISAESYAVPVPLRTGSGKPYIYNLHSGTIEEVQ